MKKKLLLRCLFCISSYLCTKLRKALRQFILRISFLATVFYRPAPRIHICAVFCCQITVYISQIVSSDICYLSLLLNCLASSDVSLSWPGSGCNLQAFIFLLRIYNVTHSLLLYDASISVYINAYVYNEKVITV